MNKLIDNKVQEGDNLNSKFEVASSLFGKGGLLEPKDEWDKLSMAAKAEMMRVAVNHGIYDLQTIRQKYNEFAGGGSVSEEEEVSTNEFGSGGSIHIKPENRGKFTALKKRTGHSASWFKEHGTPAQKKMATFAINAAKWKHGLGGNLFDGTSQPTQKMNIFRRPSGEYFYQASPESEEIAVVPRIKVSDNPAYWTYADAEGKLYTPKQTAIPAQGEAFQTEAPSTWENIIVASNNNYMNPVLGAPARWKASWDNNTNAIRALWDNPVMYAHPYTMAAKTIENLTSKDGAQKTWNLYQNSDGSDNARWLWQRSLVGDALEGLGLVPATASLYKVGNEVSKQGVRFVQDIGDRYKGMKDAVEYTTNNNIKGANAMDITNYIWKNRQGPSASKTIASYKDKAAFMKKSDGSTTAVATNGGNQTINMHLGGTHYGDKPWELRPMDKTGRFWLGEYTETAPQGTIFGEVGKTKNYAEQYKEVTPSWKTAIKDALLNKKEVNNPYWEEYKKDVLARMAGSGGDDDLLFYYAHQLDNNNPLSVDSYSMMLNMANRGKYDLRYDSSPMGLFNSLGVREKEFYNSLSELSSKEKVDAINKWIVKFNPEARPAYLRNGEVVIPRPLLKKKTKSKNTWLKK